VYHLIPNPPGLPEPPNGIFFQTLLVYLNPLMAYSKTKLKSNINKAFPCFKPFLIENIPDIHLPKWTML